jgi:DNA-binding NtrC family response regulator
MRARVVDDRVVLTGAGSDRAMLERVLAASWRHVVAMRRAGEVSHRAHVRLRDLTESRTDDELVARSPAMRRMLETLPAIARHDISVLVLGEPGAGKELVARRIHALSRRARRPFIAVNCGALPEALVESILFGHEKGAFTGATRRANGLFERAHHGTLFLDEIGDLSPAAQVKILRAVETGEITRVGGDAARVDVRVIAATHRDLESASTFRADLYFRLATCEVRVPPLRERPADVEALARMFVERHARSRGIAVPRLDASSLAALRRHAWPGNVRELENVIARAIVLHDEGPLVIDVAKRASTVHSWRVATRKIIEAALGESNGRVYGARGAAAKLGLKPTTLQSKMRKLGITSSRARPARRRRR